MKAVLLAVAAGMVIGFVNLHSNKFGCSPNGEVVKTTITEQTKLLGFAAETDSMSIRLDAGTVITDSTQADSIMAPRPSRGLIHTVFKPLTVTVLAGGVLLWLYLQRGH